MAVLFMQSQPATLRAWRTPLSLRIPFFYHLASPLPVEASYIQRSKSCWFSVGSHQIPQNHEFHPNRYRRNRFIWHRNRRSTIKTTRFLSFFVQYSICGFAALFFFSIFHRVLKPEEDFPPSQVLCLVRSVPTSTEPSRRLTPSLCSRSRPSWESRLQS